MLGTTIAVGLGPYISGILYDNFSHTGCFMAASIFSFIALICMFTLNINKFDPKVVKAKKEAKENEKETENIELSEDVTVIDDTKPTAKANNDTSDTPHEVTDVSIDITEKEDTTDIDDSKETENIQINDNDADQEKENETKETKEIKEKEKKTSLIEKVFEPGAIPISFCIALTSLGYVSILSFYRLYAAEVKLTTVFSWFFILYSVILVISRPVAGKIQDRNGDKLICIVGIIAQAVGLFLVAYVPNTFTVLVCAVCAALGFGTLNSAATTIVTKKAPVHRRSYAISTLFIFCDGTMGFGPALLGSFVSSKTGYAPVYYISSVITIVALPVCLLAMRKYKCFIK